MTKLLNFLSRSTDAPRPNMQPPLIAPPLKGGVALQFTKDSYGRSYRLTPNGVHIYRDEIHRRACVTFAYRLIDSNGALIKRERVSKKNRLRSRRELTGATLAPTLVH